MTPIGFPHSEIPGSKLISSSPRLIAGNRVFLRLFVPRHPPCALYILHLLFLFLFVLLIILIYIIIFLDNNIIQ